MGWNQGFLLPPQQGEEAGGVFMGIPEPSQPWEVKEQRCPPAWPNMCSSYSSTMKQFFFCCVLAELRACSPGRITSHFCETPWGQILPVCLTWSSNKCEAVPHLCPLFCRCSELSETLFLLHVSTVHSRGQSQRAGEVNTLRFLMEGCCLHVVTLGDSLFGAGVGCNFSQEICPNWKLWAEKAHLFGTSTFPNHFLSSPYLKLCATKTVQLLRDNEKLKKNADFLTSKRKKKEISQKQI